MGYDAQLGIKPHIKIRILFYIFKYIFNTLARGVQI